MWCRHTGTSQSAYWWWWGRSYSKKVTTSTPGCDAGWLSKLTHFTYTSHYTNTAVNNLRSSVNTKDRKSISSPTKWKPELTRQEPNTKTTDNTPNTYNRVILKVITSPGGVGTVFWARWLKELWEEEERGVKIDPSATLLDSLHKSEGFSVGERTTPPFMWIMLNNALHPNYQHNYYF